MTIDEDITLRKLEVFQAFMKLGNMARVSETLGQSTVSVHRALHSLEAGLRCPLFKRDGRKLTPLLTACVFLEHVERILRDCEDGIRRTRESAGFTATRLKIGGLYSMTVCTIPRLIIELKTRRPQVDIDLTLGSNQELLHQLQEGQLDAIVIALSEPLRNPDLLAVPMFDDDILFAAPLNSPYAQHTSIDLQALRGERFVSLSNEFATHHDFTTVFARAGFAPDITMRVGDIFSLINLVSGGIGYALLPRRVADFSPKMQLIPLTQRYAISQHIVLVMQRKRERDPNLLALSAECRMTACR